MRSCLLGLDDHGMSTPIQPTGLLPRVVADRYIVVPLGARKLRDLSADEVACWLHTQFGKISTRTLRLAHSLLNRAVKHAMARDKIKRNVVGRPAGPPVRVPHP
jgi:hypothetical protein